MRLNNRDDIPTNVYDGQVHIVPIQFWKTEVGIIVWNDVSDDIIYNITKVF